MFVRFLGHSAFVVELGGRTLVFDAWLQRKSDNAKRLVPPAVDSTAVRKADLVLVSHEHFDHCSPLDVRDIVARTCAQVVAPNESLAVLGVPQRNRVTATVGDSFTVNGVNVEVVEARHPQSFDPVGFVASRGGERVYFAGDTYAFHAMNAIDVDVALLPIGGTYTMDALSAVTAVKQLRARYVVPMHYDTFAKIGADAADFGKRVRAAVKCEPVVLKPGDGFECKQ